MARPMKALEDKLVRVPTAFVPREIGEAIKRLADEGNRPYSREVRQALEEYVARENGKSK